MPYALETLACSFCSKKQSEVLKLFAGDSPGVSICDECVLDCAHSIETLVIKRLPPPFGEGAADTSSATLSLDSSELGESEEGVKQPEDLSAPETKTVNRFLARLGVRQANT